MAKKINTLDDLCPDLRNPNRHTQRGQALTQKSIQSYGFGDSITTDKNGKVISGNSRTEILADVQMLDPIVVQSDGTRPIIHQRTDLDLDTDDRARLLSIAMNRTAEVSLDWDPAVLQELIGEGLDLSDLFFENELALLSGNVQFPDDPRELWNDMPDMGTEANACRQITIYFKKPEDVEDFANLLDQTVTDNTKSLWFPLKQA